MWINTENVEYNVVYLQHKLINIDFIDVSYQLSLKIFL